ncbi:helix-turn-helix domain-containing protein [Microbacterium oxydans]|uniref:helix-turn-helix domain-containing protein n=1 Tax=Microbacterium oxydans TaxID=82380 RepID=UPI00226B7863|nr:helix-turn-helix domain-containing protein [Microbacterium oxydans]WAA66408.1 GAF domain-containing protein [Microbacterium oxydans]
MLGSADSAVITGADGAAYNRLLSRVHEAMATGTAAPARPRETIAESWRRLRQRGLRPDRNTAAASLRGDTSAPHADRLRRLFPQLLTHAQPLVDDNDTLLVLADADGTLIDTAGHRRSRDRAEEIGFLPGHFWAEQNVGTNAIGTALVTKRPVAVHGAEHFLIGQHGWSCAAAPIRDPWTGVIQGVVDLSLPLDQAHPALLALASSIARTASLELAAAHRRDLDLLRARSVAETRGLATPWAVIDDSGWVADSSGVDARRRISIPGTITAGDEWIAPLGEVDVIPLEHGWLLRGRDGGTDEHDATALVEIRRGDTGREITVFTGTRRRAIAVTPRQADILVLLAHSDHGFSAAELSAQLYGTPERDVTVRAEISRLRRTLGTLIAASPYRFAAGVVVEFAD